LRLGLILPMFSGDIQKVLSFARRAEDLGYDGVFAFDHFFPPGASPDRPSLEAFATLASVGAATERVAVGTLVTRAQLRPAGLLAKMAAGIDEMTGGRMILGIGTGDPIDQPEHDAFGFSSLGASARRVHLAETVRAVQALFLGETWPGGEYVPPMTGPLLPPPARHGGPPVWLGAQSDEVVGLAGRVADGWNGWGLVPEKFARKAALLAEEARGVGRDAEATWAGIALVGEDDRRAAELMEARRTKGMTTEGVWSGGVGSFVEFVGRLSEVGATWAVLVPAGPPDRVDLIAREVLPTLGRGEVAGSYP
jgi:alkanesulfonate monooxygenase SsuD/methylene tetrahydromethanopterin reductase-like flavin-dependent oxidoreductase (luciferase family)